MADAYEVTNQRPTTTAGPGGVVVPAIEVTFTTKPSGVEGSVRIPQAGYTVDAVRQAIEHQAGVLEAVQNL